MSKIHDEDVERARDVDDPSHLFTSMTCARHNSSASGSCNGAGEDGDTSQYGGGVF